ncbi:MAG: hypothetical protein ACRC33_13915, partial [Gemmataceae bacterium]
MTTEGAPAAVEKLAISPHPLTPKEAAKGVPKRKKEKPAEVEARVRAALDAEVGAGRAFRQPSGKAGAARYWGRDERQVLREAAARLDAKPAALAAFSRAVAKETKADPAFVSLLMPGLI